MNLNALGCVLVGDGGSGYEVDTVSMESMSHEPHWEMKHQR
jgi:hypothetical protein